MNFRVIIYFQPLQDDTSFKMFLKRSCQWKITHFKHKGRSMWQSWPFSTFLQKLSIGGLWDIKPLLCHRVWQAGKIVKVTKKTIWNMDLYPLLSVRKHAIIVSRMLSNVRVTWSGLRRYLITRHSEHEKLLDFLFNNSWCQAILGLKLYRI